MQQPTCTNVRIRSTADAHKIFGSIQQGLLHMVTRRLDAEERHALRSGCVYAWEERGPHSEITGLGIERFTEGRRWSPSRVRDVCFLFFLFFPTPHLFFFLFLHPIRVRVKLTSQIFLRNFFSITRNTLHLQMSTIIIITQGLF